jgi:hypothetical protein
MHQDGKIEIEGESYYNPSKNLDIGDESSFAGNLFQLAPDKPEGQDRADTKIVTDY